MTVRALATAAALAVAIVVPALPAPAGAATFAAPDTIPADCSVDVSAAINAWIASVPDGSTLTFTPNGCYRTDNRIVVNGRNDLVIDGQGATFRQVTDGRELGTSLARTRSIWTFNNGARLTLRNTIAIGANPHAGIGDLAYVAALEAQTAYVVGGVQTMTIDHVQAFDVYGDFVFVGPGARGLTVTNSTFARNGRQGWTINGEDIVFDHNTISDTRRATIDIEPATRYLATRRVTISNNTVGRGRLLFFANYGAPAPVEDISIVGNHLVGKPMTIRVNPPSGLRYRYKVIGNTSDTAISYRGGGALQFHDVQGLEVRDNAQPVAWNSGTAGVAIGNVHDATVTGNRFRYAPAPICYRSNDTNVAQSGNLIRNPLVLAPATLIVGPTVSTADAPCQPNSL